MLLDTFTPEEMYKYLDPIRERIGNYTYSLASRFCKKSNKNVWIPLGVRHVTVNNDLYYFIPKGMYYKKGIYEAIDTLIVCYCMITRNDGSRYILEFDGHGKKVLQTYEIHLFQRYRERFLNNPSLGLWDTIHEFFKNNYAGGIFQNLDVGYVKIIHDGVVLSREMDLDLMSKVPMYHFKTFITEEMLFKDQNHMSQHGGAYNSVQEANKTSLKGGVEYKKDVSYQLNISIDSLQK